MSIERSAAPQTVRGVERAGTPTGHPSGMRPGAGDDAPGSFLSLLSTLGDVLGQQDGVNNQAPQVIDATSPLGAPFSPVPGLMLGQSTTPLPATVELDAATSALSLDLTALPSAGVLGGAAAVAAPGGIASAVPGADQPPALPAPFATAWANVSAGATAPMVPGAVASLAGMDGSLENPSAMVAPLTQTTTATTALSLSAPTPPTAIATQAPPFASNVLATHALRPGVDALSLSATQSEPAGSLVAPVLQPLAGKASGPRGRWIEVRPNPAENQVLTEPDMFRATQMQALAASAVLAEVVSMVTDKPIPRDGARGVPALVSGLSGFELVAAPPSAGFDPDLAVGANAQSQGASPAPPDLAIAQRVHYWITRGVQNAELQLDALGGGSVDVRVSVQGNEALVEFRSDQPEARRMLQDAMPQLKDMLKSEGLVLSSGFVGTSAQPDREARGQAFDRPRADGAQNKPDADALARSIQPTRSSGRAIDVFV